VRRRAERQEKCHMFRLSRRHATAIVLSALAALALVVNAGVALADLRRIAEADARVRHTDAVVEALHALLASLVDAETGERGFIITGDESYLEPFTAGVAATEERLKRLAELTRDDPAQQRRIEAMRPVVAERLAVLQRLVALRRGGARGFESARAALLAHEGKRLTDELRVAVADMSTQEKTLLAVRASASAAASQRAVVSTLVGVGASLALLAGAFASFRRRVRERDRAAAQLHDEKERFRTILTSVGDAVIVTDGAGRIAIMNGTAREVTGWDDAALGRPLDEVFRIVNEETRRDVENPVAKVLREGRTVGLANHTVLLRRDGGEVPIDDSGAPVRDADGTVVAVVLVFRDIHERREAERELAARATLLEEQDRRKDQFLAVLSHELRNPLAPIRNALAILARRDATPDQAQRARGIMERQVDQLRRLVDDLLDVSRISQGKVRLVKEQVNLEEAVRRTVEDHRTLFNRKRIAVDFHDGGGGAPWVEADATRLAQIVGNLLQNAAKFTPHGGHVAVTLASEANRAVLTVRDDGAGMDDATLARLFQPFMQADSTLARTEGGLGLGLALTKSLVELHGGTVQATSDGLGRGTEFVVTLPATRDAVPPRRANGAAATAARRVLIIEDNEDAGSTLRDLLELDGHEVMVAHDGRAGVEAALATRPDVVLCDVGLPDLDGFEVARRLRAAGSRARLVALSGYAAPDDVARARGAGFDEHLAKPPDLDRLAHLLASAPPLAAGA
jgi:PAS domain S-box-containing protein